MSSLLTSQSVVLATAMAAVSGTVILLAAIRHQKTHPRPCLSSSSSSDDANNKLKNKKKKKKKKRVHFAEDVVEPIGDGAEFRKRHRNHPSSSTSNSNIPDFENDARQEEVLAGRITGMPANRAALYSGMLRDRIGHRLAYSSY